MHKFTTKNNGVTFEVKCTCGQVWFATSVFTADAIKVAHVQSEADKVTFGPGHTTPTSKRKRS